MREPRSTEQPHAAPIGRRDNGKPNVSLGGAEVQRFANADPSHQRANDFGIPISIAAGLATRRRALIMPTCSSGIPYPAGDPATGRHNHHVGMTVDLRASGTASGPQQRARDESICARSSARERRH